MMNGLFSLLIIMTFITIVSVLDQYFRLLGTPTEDQWPAMTQLPNYRVCFNDIHVMIV
jgi:hypothetical protein